MANQNMGAMLNAYPDSMGGNLENIVSLLSRPELKGAFSSFYILPSIFNTDLDRGFSLIDYGLNRLLSQPEDLENLKKLDIDLALDFILNHASVLSKEFQDILKNGDQSPYRDFFIDWNRFWEGHGEMTPQGYIQPDPELIRNMFFRKPGLPILMVRFPDGRDVPYWNTFYQNVRYDPVDAQDLMQAAPLQYGEAARLAEMVNAALADGKTPSEMDFGSLNAYRDAVCGYLESRRKYLGQMDLNIRSPLVWDYYRKTLETLAGYGASIVRLDAFAYAPKEVGARNFLNDPGTWELLDRVAEIAKPLGLTLLPEIHASYGEKTYELLASKGYMVYDFFLPGLVIDAMERRSGENLKRWIDEIVEKKIRTVNMLGCHDGIPLLDLKGLLDETSIQSLIDTVVGRGGYVKNLHGRKERLRGHEAGRQGWSQGDQSHQSVRRGYGSRTAKAGCSGSAEAFEAAQPLPGLFFGRGNCGADGGKPAADYLESGKPGGNTGGGLPDLRFCCYRPEYRIRGNS